MSDMAIYQQLTTGVWFWPPYAASGLGDRRFVVRGHINPESIKSSDT